MINFKNSSISQSLQHYSFLEIFKYILSVYNPRISFQSVTTIHLTSHTKFHFFSFLSAYYIFQ